MISLHACPRCDGAVLEHGSSDDEDAGCINCGWRRQDIPEDVTDRVQAHLGKPSIDNYYTRQQIGQGKPPLSGWDRIKHQRELLRRRLPGFGSAKPE